MTMDGILARDLQLRPSSKFAYLLRPLPTRAAQLDAYAQYYRRRILRVVSVSKSAKRSVITCALRAEPHNATVLLTACLHSSGLSPCMRSDSTSNWGMTTRRTVAAPQQGLKARAIFIGSRLASAGG